MYTTIDIADIIKQKKTLFDSSSVLHMIVPVNFLKHPIYLEFSAQTALI